MPGRTTSIKVTGNVTEALAALDHLGLKAEAVAKETEGALGGAARRSGGAFQKLGGLGASFGIPFSESFTRIGDKIAEAETKGKRFAAQMAGVGKAVTLGATVGIVGFGTESIKAASSFQSAMEQIHTQAGASQAEVDKMSQAVLGLAGQTATAPNELAAALYHLESAGMRGAQALAALKVAALGAKVGHADLESVTNALNASIASGIPGVQNLHQAMGSLNAIVGAGDMRMQDLADALGTGVLAAVKGYGLSLNDVGAALATFGDNNIRGSDAAQQLRQTVMAFAVPAAAGAKTLKKLGLSTVQLREDMASGGLTKAIKDLREHLDKAGVKANEVGGILTEAFGKKAGTGVSVLIGQYDRYMSKTKEVKDGANNFNESVAATQKTLQYQQEQLKASVEALAVRFGSWLIPKLQQLAAWVERVVKWFEKHKDAAKALAAVITGVLGAAVGAFVVNKLAGLVRGIAGAVTEVGRMGSALYHLAQRFLGVGDAAKQMATDTEGANTRAVSSTEASDAKIQTSNDTTAASTRAKGTAAGTMATETETANTKAATSTATADTEIEGENTAAAGSYAERGAAAETGAVAGGAPMVAPMRATGGAAGAVEGEAGALAATEGAAATEGEAAAVGIGGMGTAAGSAVPVIGALAIGVGILGKTIASKLDSRASGAAVAYLGSLASGTESLTTAMVNDQSQMSSLGDQWVRAQLQSTGLADKAAQAGITVDQLSFAVEHGSAATQQLVERWQASGAPADTTIMKLMALAGSYNSTTQKVQGLITKQGQIKPITTVKVTADVSQAMAAFQDLTNSFSNLQNNVNAKIFGASASGHFGTVARASGGFVYGAGSATSDSIPARLSNGEYVLSDAMLTGSQPVDPHVAAAVAANSSAHGGAGGRGGVGTINVAVTAQTNASPYAMANDLHFMLRQYL